MVEYTVALSLSTPDYLPPLIEIFIAAFRVHPHLYTVNNFPTKKSVMDKGAIRSFIPIQHLRNCILKSKLNFILFMFFIFLTVWSLVRPFHAVRPSTPWLIVLLINLISSYSCIPPYQTIPHLTVLHCI